MTIVALETSSRAASVAVRHGGRVLAARLDAERAHASDLFPRLAALFRELGAAPASIEAVFVGTGPGSYTGLRVGIATALGLARGSGAKLLGVPSGETLVHERAAPGGEAACLLDARAGELYFARYRRTEHGVETVVAPRVLRPAELDGALLGDVPILADSGAADAAGLDARTRARIVAGVTADARALLELGAARLAERGPTPEALLEPLYLRPFATTARRR